MSICSYLKKTQACVKTHHTKFPHYMRLKSHMRNLSLLLIKLHRLADNRSRVNRAPGGRMI